MIVLESETDLQFASVSRYFILIGDERRGHMLLMLADGPKTPDELVGDAPRNEAQRDIRKLKEAGLVEIDRASRLGYGHVWRLTRAGRQAAITLAEVGRSHAHEFFKRSPDNRTAQISPS
jgi:DNA-binding transcriptional ArsR family regulator